MKHLVLFDELRRQTVQHRQQQRADLEAVHVGIGAQDDLAQRSALMSNDAMDLFAFDFTCTPQPSTLMRSVMISL